MSNAGLRLWPGQDPIGGGNAQDWGGGQLPPLAPCWLRHWSGFADFGLNYLTNGTFYLRALNESDFVCKPLRGLGYFGLHCSHWLYVLVNADRLLAVLMPHRSQRSRKRRCLMLLAGLLLISGILTGGFSAFMYRVNNSVAVGGALSINYKYSYIFRMIVTVLVLRP